MEPIPQSKMMLPLSRTLGLALLFLTGCMGGTSSEFFAGKPQGPPPEGVCEVAAMWKTEVVYTPDPTRGGQKIPGLAGRLYFYGEKKDYTKAADGAVVVDLYDMTHADPQTNMPPLEEWRIDKDTLQRLFRQDAIGWGYTVFLPWTTYRPELTRVELRVSFRPVKGAPIFGQSEPMTLNSDMDLTINQSTSQIPPLPKANASGPWQGSVPPNQNQVNAGQPARLGINPLEGLQAKGHSAQPNNAGVDNSLPPDWFTGNK